MHMFHLNGEGVSYNGKGRFVFILFRENGTITLYYRMYVHAYVCVCRLCWGSSLRRYTCTVPYVCTYVRTSAIQGPTVTSVVCAWPMSGCYEL